MKKTFIWWITIQLVIIGMSSIWIHNQIVKETLDCKQYKHDKLIPEVVGAVFPLALFIPDDHAVEKYCGFEY